MPLDTRAVGTQEERKTFTEVVGHYDMAKEDLSARLSDFDTKDELFRSYINESGWPYQSLVFDPRIFTAIFEKTSRLFANKPRGRLVPREGGDTLGARINNELLSFQWDDNERVDNMPMLAKWAMMDMNTRKYGASFALCKWHYERKVMKNDEGEKKSLEWYDASNFRPLPNRDCLPNPAYSTVKNWFQFRDYVTIEELKNTNDAARSKPVYKNLDILLDRIKGEDITMGGDTRASNYASRNLAIRGLTDYLGKDKVPEFRVVEIVTEYRDDRWIVFAPKHGVIIRDIPNPYDHGQIPVVMLRYYAVDDDIYGLSEIDPIETTQKAINALVNQYLDAINMDLYKVLKVRATGVQMHTLRWGPGEKWIMNDPSSDVIEVPSNAAGIQQFTSTYSFLVASMQNALGESSLGIANVGEFQKQKTATEVRDLAMQRNARDNFNAIFLAEALKKQMMFWFLMNRQFMFQDEREKIKIIRIVGKDAIRYFQKMGLGATAVPDEAAEALASPGMEGINILSEELEVPMFPVETEEGVVSKFEIETGGEAGRLYIEPEDLAGHYDYIPDIESMQIPDDTQVLAAKKQMIELAQNPATQQTLMQEGFKLKLRELMEDFFEQIGLKDADKYFEQAGPEQGQPATPGQPLPGGEAAVGGMPQGGGTLPQPGMEGGSQAVPGVQV